MTVQETHHERSLPCFVAAADLVARTVAAQALNAQKIPASDHDAEQGRRPASAHSTSWMACPTEATVAEGVRQPRLHPRREVFLTEHSREHPCMRLRKGFTEHGAEDNHACVIFDRDLMDSQSTVPDRRTATPFTAGAISTCRPRGRSVLEIPPDELGTIDDACFRFVIDLGVPGPDAGKGGKYLLVPPDYKGSIPKDNMVRQRILRGRSRLRSQHDPAALLRSSTAKPNAAATISRKTARIYPLSQAAAVRPHDEVHRADPASQFNTVHANDYRVLSRNRTTVVQHEPVDFLDPELRGLCGRIGIVKGKQVHAGCADEENPQSMPSLSATLRPGNVVLRRAIRESANLSGNRQWSLRLSSAPPITRGSTRRERRADPRCPRQFYYAYTIGHAGDDHAAQPGAGSQYANRDFADSDRQSLRRCQDLQGDAAGERPRRKILVVHGLRQPDALVARRPTSVTREREATFPSPAAERIRTAR